MKPFGPLSGGRSEAEGVAHDQGTARPSKMERAHISVQLSIDCPIVYT